MSSGNSESGGNSENSNSSRDTVRVGFIGAGKVGFSLGKYIAKSGGTVCGYYSRSSASADEAAFFTGSTSFTSPGQLLPEADIVFVTVPDDVLPDVWRGIVKNSEGSGAPVAGKLFCHCSGSLPSSVFEGAEDAGALVCSLHPLLAVADRRTSWKHLADACFTFEGSEEAFEVIAPLIGLMGNKTGRISPDKKILYHTACVFFSNLAVGLAGCGVSLLEACGLDSGFSETAWHALFLGNSKNIVHKGVAGALTGPVERGDAQTIKSHIEALDALQTLQEIQTPAAGTPGTADTAENAAAIYRELSKTLIKIASEKHPNRDYSAVRNTMSTT
ncbi:MAG: DUF2520 domain-containing protein [Clostridiales Family XIII bacterium]|jgi:predicted short-subunit dehydrogenase-like oxidoreductase (DUF2520 family)|nr:DUF2520 domain-containing protein [Clostridiales Family XIII bacterium]